MNSPSPFKQQSQSICPEHSQSLLSKTNQLHNGHLAVTTNTYRRWACKQLCRWCPAPWDMGLWAGWFPSAAARPAERAASWSPHLRAPLWERSPGFLRALVGLGQAVALKPDMENVNPYNRCKLHSTGCSTNCSHLPLPHSYHHFSALWWC